MMSKCCQQQRIAGEQHSRRIRSLNSHVNLGLMKYSSSVYLYLVLQLCVNIVNKILNWQQTEDRRFIEFENKKDMSRWAMVPISYMEQCTVGTSVLYVSHARLYSWEICMRCLSGVMCNLYWSALLYTIGCNSVILLPTATCPGYQYVASIRNSWN